MRARVWKAPHAIFAMLVAPATRRGLRSSCMLKSPQGSPHIQTCQAKEREARSCVTLQITCRASFSHNTPAVHPTRARFNVLSSPTCPAAVLWLCQVAESGSRDVSRQPLC